LYPKASFEYPIADADKKMYFIIRSSAVFTNQELGKMKTIRIILVLCLFAWPAMAGDEQMRSEIDHLITYIQNSNCQFIRNGKAHTPGEAIQHILKKYDHFKAKIHTTEEFIELCATKSILSDQPYKIGCPDQKMIESKHWLLRELKNYRNQ
jgi:hypothetical protein